MQERVYQKPRKGTVELKYRLIRTRSGIQQCHWFDKWSVARWS